MKIKFKALLPTLLTVPAIFVPLTFTSCKPKLLSYRVEPPIDKGEYIKETDYSKVFIISGQSNADGCSYTEYLQYFLTKDELNHFKDGIKNIQISYSNNAILPSESETQFQPTTCYCGFTNKQFGPEVGFADIMEKYSSKPIYIIKYGVSGSWLDGEWLKKDGTRGNLYNNLAMLVNRQMSKLENAKICGVCWMQGEYDSINKNSSKKYFNNLSTLVGYMREDFKDYAPAGGIPFVDAGISNISDWKYYDNVNKSKIDFWKTNENLNAYFSTWEVGLTTTTEPWDKPDTYHYDSFSELQLGRWFALKTIELFNKNN